MTSGEARELFANPLEFERLGFALTRQFTDVPCLHFGTSQGEFLSVQRQAQGIRVGARSATDIGRSNYMATSSADKLCLLNVDILQRMTPLDSSNLLMAQSFLLLATQVGLTSLVTQHEAAGKPIAFGDPREMVSITRPVAQALNLKWTLVVTAPRSDFSQGVTSSLNQLLGILTALMALAGLAGPVVRRRIEPAAGSTGRCSQAVGE